MPGIDCRESRTKSRFCFELDDPVPAADISLFRDPAAVPLLDKVVAALRLAEFDVTDAHPGKACHAAARVTFPSLSISLVLLVERDEGTARFELLTWPFQSFRQGIFGKRLRSPGDCNEWTLVASEIERILVGYFGRSRVVTSSISEDRTAFLASAGYRTRTKTGVE